MEMAPAETEWFSCHFGHNVAIHKKNYRLHTSAVEITKVGPLLDHIDSGAIGRRTQPNKGLPIMMQLHLSLINVLKTSKSVFNSLQKGLFLK